MEDAEAGMFARRRVKNACQGCKASKIKCDGEYPCVNCLRKGKPCEYLVKAFETLSDGPKKADGETKSHPLKIGEEEMNNINKFREIVGTLVPCFQESILLVAIHGKTASKQDPLYPKIQRSCLTATWAAVAYGAFLENNHPRAQQCLESALTLYRGCFDVTTSETVCALTMLALVHDHLGIADKLRLYTGFADVIYRTVAASGRHDASLPVSIQFLKTLAYFIDPDLDPEPVIDRSVEQNFPEMPLPVRILHQVNCAVRVCSTDAARECHILQDLLDRLDIVGGYSANPIGFLSLHVLYARACVATQRIREAVRSLYTVKSKFVAAPSLVCNAFTWHLFHCTIHQLRVASADVDEAMDVLRQKAQAFGITPHAIGGVFHPFTASAVRNMEAAVWRERSFQQSAGFGNDFFYKPKAFVEQSMPPVLPPFTDMCEVRPCGSTESGSTETFVGLPTAFQDDDLDSNLLYSFPIKREPPNSVSSEDIPLTKRAFQTSNYGAPYDDNLLHCSLDSVGYQPHDHRQLTQSHRPLSHNHHRASEACGAASHGGMHSTAADEASGLPHVFFPLGDLVFGSFSL